MYLSNTDAVTNSVLFLGSLTYNFLITEHSTTYSLSQQDCCSWSGVFTGLDCRGLEGVRLSHWWHFSSGPGFSFCSSSYRPQANLVTSVRVLSARAHIQGSTERSHSWAEAGALSQLQESSEQEEASEWTVRKHTNVRGLVDGVRTHEKNPACTDILTWDCRSILLLCQSGLDPHWMILKLQRFLFSRFGLEQLTTESVKVSLTRFVSRACKRM